MDLTLTVDLGVMVICILFRKVGRIPRSVLTKVLDLGLKVNEFKLQSRYYIHFRTNILG